jgi:Flp pilus assembly protein TadD/TolB-like protein
MADWDRIEELFHELAPLDPHARDVALGDITARDPELAAELRTILAAHDATGVLDVLNLRLGDIQIGAGSGEHDALTGRTVGPYEVGPLIGRGGMGDVYRARDPRLDRELALKFLPRWMGREPAARERFLVEARVVCSIDHPNVCLLLGLGETDDGRLYLVMPHYEGETLKSRLGRGPLPLREAVDLALQLARGLDAVHRRGVVHRDIKPANVLITADGAVKILDFGVAKLADVELTRTGQHPGTASYMAPEQILGNAVDGRADLWALGLVLYEMLTGRRPARDPMTGMVSESGPSGLSGLPGGVVDVVRRLLAAAPDDRYPDARALVGDLALLARGRRPREGRTSRLLGRATRPLTSVRRRPVLAAVAAIVAALVMMVSARGIVGRSASAPASSAIIAVLNFRPLGQRSDELAAAITRSARDRLSVIGGIDVIGGTSSNAARFRAMSAPEVARSLGADYTLSATVEVSAEGRRIEVRPELYGANGTEIPLWERSPIVVESSDLSLVVGRIAEDVAQALDVTIGVAARAQLAPPSRSPAAYQAYLRGLTQRGSASEERFREALALDSTVALAHVALASQAFGRTWFGASSADSAQMRDHAAAAIRYAPRLYRGYLGMGLFHRSVTRDNDSALVYFRRAVALAPGNAEVRHFLATVLWNAGMLDSALTEARRAAALDPLNPSAVSRVSRILFWRGELEQAWAQHLEARKLALRGGPVFVLADGPKILAAMGLPDSARALTSQLRDPELRAETVRYLLSETQSWLLDDSLVLRICAEGPEGARGSTTRASRVHCARALDERGQHAEARLLASAALPELRSRVLHSPADEWARMRLAWAQLLTGDTAAAVAQADSSLGVLDRFWDYAPGAINAVAYVQLTARAGDARRSIRQLRRMLEGDSPMSLAWVEVDPAFDPIRNESGYRELLREATLGGSDR